MDDADDVLLLALGVALGAKADVPRTIRAFDGDVDALTRVLHAGFCAIDGERFARTIAAKLPNDVSERFRCAEAYSEALKAIGCAPELGFQAILYPNARETRAMLQRVLDSIPRTNDLGSTVNGNSVNANIDSRGEGAQAKRAARAIGKSLRAQATWGKARGLAGFAGVVGKANAKKKTEDATEMRQFATVRLSTESTSDGFLSVVTGGRTLPSVLEYVARSRAETEREEDARRLKFGGLKRIEFMGPDGEVFDLRKRGGLRGLVTEICSAATEGGFYAATEPKARRAKRDIEEKTTEIPMDEAKVVEKVLEIENAALDTLEGRLHVREKDIEDVQHRIDEALSTIEAVDHEIAACALRVQEALESTENKRALTAELEATYLLHKQAVGMVLGTDRPVEESEAELNKVLEASKERMEKLTTEWEAAKAPLVEAIEAHAAAAREKRENAKRQLEEIETWRREGKETGALLRVKEHEQRQLLEEYEAAPKNVHRPSFVRRVNEIIKNIKKQEVEVQKIVNDTRSVQADIKSAEAVLQRTYAMVEETLFREARSDDLCKAAYKHLHGMHTGFAELVSKVEATGAARRAQTDLQRKLGELMKQPNNTERVARDLTLMNEKIISLEQEVVRLSA